MPPRAKFTRDEILDMALRITEEQGIDAVTARELGARLGSSARPIFTVFASMEEVKDLVMDRARALYGQYVQDGLKEPLAFKGVGVAYIRFAIQHPKLFQLLFMRSLPGPQNVSGILPVIEEHYDRILQSVQEPYRLDEEAAKMLYQHLWTYTHGIAAMCATGTCSYTKEQIGERLTEVFTGLLLLEKGKEKHDQHRKST